MNVPARTAPAVRPIDRPSGTPAIAATALRKKYGEVTALDGLSFAVESGTVFGLLGPNGAGKSTTIKILTTLSLPTSGTATVAGADVLKRPDAVRRAIGVVTQKVASDPSATGQENLLLAGHLHGLRGAAARVRVDELLQRFGLTDAARRAASTYSGGMLRKLDVAMGLVHRPQVLFLDEPTTGLDPEARSDMWAEISRLTHQESVTVLLTTHYLEEADQLADQIAIVDHGRIVAQGTSDQLKSELRGDAVVIAIGAETDPAAARAAVEGVGAASEVVIDGRQIRARVADGGAALPVMLAALTAKGIGVPSITIARPSLDDVYLRHTGRSFASAERQAS